MPVRSTTTTVTTTTYSSSSSSFPSTFLSSSSRTRAVLLARTVACILSCAAFSLSLDRGLARQPGGVSSWCLFSWGWSFCLSLLLLVYGLAPLTPQASSVCPCPSSPQGWGCHGNLPAAAAAYHALLCLSASAAFPAHFLVSFPAWEGGWITALSCLACAAFCVEVWLLRTAPGQHGVYMSTVPGWLKVCQTFLGCALLVFASGLHYQGRAALSWCVAVYALCLLASLAVALWSSCISLRPRPPEKCLSLTAILCCAMYATATVLWPLYSFSGELGGLGGGRLAHCGRARGTGLHCDWDTSVLISVLTALNFLLYLGDLVYSSRLVYITTPTS